MTEHTEPQVDTYQFQAEISQLLDILVHSLYKEREIFLRELVSNASDALTRMHFEMLTNANVLDPDLELAVHIETSKSEDEKWLIVKDTGIGMTADQLRRDLGTIAQSGAREFLSKLEIDETDAAEIIGQFGVGFYSAFMVAEEIHVVSRSYEKDAEAARWISSGGESFTVEPAEKSDRGTEIHLKLRNDAIEFADESRLKEIVRKHSDYVGYPVYVGGEQANKQRPLWRQSPSEVTETEYQQFYQQMTMDFENPIRSIHIVSDAPLHIRALLFIPARREKSVLNLRKEVGPKLYSHNVLIQEYAPDLLPAWLGFVDGVVDSEDIPLNVSRESVQNTRIMRQLNKAMTRRVLRELETLAKDDSKLYNDFWNQYGRVLKEGLAIETDIKDEVLPLFRFYSSDSESEYTTLDAYIERMAENQEEIYYLLGEDKQSVRFSPHLDQFKSKNIEVLFLVDPLDAFIAPALTTYQDLPLRSIDDASLSLPDSEEASAPDRVVDNEVEAKFNRLIGKCVTTLGNRITEVRTSKVLKNSPVRLVTPEDKPASSLQRIYRYLDQDYEVPQKVFEINKDHPLIGDLANLVTVDPGNELIELSIEQLYESALVSEGLHPNPSAMLPRIEKLMEIAASSRTEGGK